MLIDYNSTFIPRKNTISLGLSSTSGRCNMCLDLMFKYKCPAQKVYHPLNEDQTAFASFDEEFAKSNGLTEEEYVSIDVFFDLGYEEFMIFKAAKLELEDNDTPKSVTMSKADPTPPVAKLALVIAGMIFLGQALIKDLTSDLYKLGAKKFCGKYSKKYKPIKNSCKSLGYIK